MLTNSASASASSRLPEAAAAFRQALAIDPPYARGYTNLAALALLEGDADAARDYYQRAIGVDPKNVHARMQLARIYEERAPGLRARGADVRRGARDLAGDARAPRECIERNQQLAARGGAP